MIKNELALQKLFLAADAFIKKANGGTQIWASSLDWFQQEWGRDTFISLPGLLLSTKRFEDAKSVISRFSLFQRNGLIPNRIADASRPETIEYNTVDASMWFIQSIKKYVDMTHDWEFVRQMVPTIQVIIQNYKTGARYQRNERNWEIKMDEDGLIQCPPQSTWMDADPEGRGPITPRNGKPVEINALWYSNLKFLSATETKLVVNHAVEESLTHKVKRSFNDKFWNESEDALYDVIEGDPHQGAIRPNMIFAVSHGEDLLPPERATAVFESVTEDLLTPYGLRTLSPRDSHYHGIYETDRPPMEKDQAYHQGTVWPWLIGSYIDALVKVREFEGKSSQDCNPEIRYILSPLLDYLLRNPTGSLPELFDGNPPHRPGGTRSQAWSVAEVLRVFIENKVRPK